MNTKKPVYLLFGPENGEKKEFVRSVLNELTRKSGEKPDTHTVYPFEMKMGELVSLLQNGSLFTSHTAVTIMNAEELKKEEAAIIAEYCSSPSRTGTLFLFTDTNQVDARISRSIPKEQQKIFWEMFENRKRDWLQRYFRQAGLSISPEAIEMILEMVENNTEEMKIACDKLALFFDRGSDIREDDIEAYIYHSKEENVFTLFDKITSADFSGSLETLRTLYLSGSGNGVQLLGGLLWQFRRLLLFTDLCGKQYSTDEAGAKAGIRGKRNLKNCEQAAKNYSLESLKRIIVLICRFDGVVREIRTDLQLLMMELFLYYCIRKKGKPSEGSLSHLPLLNESAIR